VARRVCDDGPLPEEQETEGQRQLHNLLLQQLDTDVDIDRCVAKKKCFAPAALYKPFGEQAAGVRSLAQFQALQDGEQELASLRELGLTDAEIQLWRNRDVQDKTSSGKNRAVIVAPEARDERMQVIWDKMVARAELLSRPQRFSGSRALTRREMEIEKALFHGTDRSNFLTALYHQEGASDDGQQGATFSNPMDSLYRDILNDQQKHTERVTYFPQTDSDHNRTPRLDPETDPDPDSDRPNALNSQSEVITHSENQESASVTQKPTVNQPIGRVTSCRSPVTVSGTVEEISDEEIRDNRETEDGIRRISRFQNYQRGEPSNVLCVKNMSPRASLSQLVALFSRFQKDDTNPIVYRILTGRLKGQAFITFSDIETAQAALDTVNGYRLQGKVLVIEFARERRQAKTEDSPENPRIKESTAQKDLRS
ncbi:RNA-binding protein 41, partial [Tachysurus ichikawai]